MRTYCTRISAPKTDPVPSQNMTKSPLVVVSEEPSLTPAGSDGEGDAPAPKPGLHPHPPTPRTPKTPPLGSPRDVSPKGEKGETKRKKKGEQIASRHPKSHKRGTGPPGNPPGSKINKAMQRQATLQLESSNLSPSNGKIVLFVSFLFSPSPPVVVVFFSYSHLDPLPIDAVSPLRDVRAPNQHGRDNQQRQGRSSSPTASQRVSRPLSLPRLPQPHPAAPPPANPRSILVLRY